MASNVEAYPCQSLCVLDEHLKRRAGWPGNARLLLRCRRTTTSQFQLKALLPHAHGPAVIGRENGLKQEGEGTQQRLFGADPPIIDDMHPFAAWFKRPNAAPHKV